jgi:hypothetical protein
LIARRVEEAVAERAARDDLAALEDFAAARGRGKGAAEGAAAVVAALQQSQVATLIVDSRVTTAASAGFGPEPTQLAISEADLAAMGVTEARRGDLVDVMLRAAVGTGADLLTISGDIGGAPADGLGALLRFDPAAQSASVV